MTVMTYQGRSYALHPDIATWLEIEDEIGSLAGLSQRLASGHWRLGELLAAAHALLSAAGCDCDYLELGREMMARGADAYRQTLANLLRQLVGGKQEEQGDDAAF